MDVSKININTIRWKAVLSAVVGAAVLSAVIMLVQDRILLGKISDYSKLSANIRSDKYVEFFEDGLSKTIIKLQTCAETITEQTTQSGYGAKSITDKMLLKLMETDQTIRSVFIISEPYIFDNSDSLLVNTNPGFPIGWYIKYIQHENTGTPELSNDIQTTCGEIYDLYRQIKHDLTPKAASLKNDADISNVIVCAIPFFTKGKFSGIIGIDIDQKYYRNILDTRIPADNTLYIADSTGNIFYSRNKDFQNRNIHEVLRFTEEKLSIMSKTSENLPVDAECELVENNNEKVYIHNKRISLPCNSDNFTVIAITPVKKIKSEQYKAVSKSALIVLAVLTVFVIFIVAISKSLSNPVTYVKNLIVKLTDGKFDTIKTSAYNGKIPKEYQTLIAQIEKLSKSLKVTAEFAQAVKDGRFDEKYDDSVKENTIGNALVGMRDNLINEKLKEQERSSIEKQNQWATEGHSIFSDILRNNISDIHKLCNAVIDRLVPYINVIQGGMFIRTVMEEDKKTECFELYAVFAYGHERFHKRILRLDEGMTGACAMEKHTIILNNVPENYSDISSGLGQAKPKSIIFVPLVYNDYLYGVMELASFKSFEQYQIQFVERISENIASTIANARINEQTTTLLQQSRQQSKIMEEKEDQLKSEIESLNNLLDATQMELDELEQVNNAMNKSMMVAIFSTKGDTLEANRKFALRYTLDVNDIRRKNVYEILQLTLSKYDEFKKIWDNVKQGATETYNIEFKINNSTRNIRNMFVPIYNKENGIDRIFCLATDITGQHNTEDELTKMKKQLKDNSAEYSAMKQSLKKRETELEELSKELVSAKQQNAENKAKLDKANASAQFFKRELEKRISKFRKIENSLKEKVKNYETQLGINKNNQNNNQNNE
jgi:PAS domain-containing protein